ncbi:DNA-dependent metalloprotease SPRTN [Festucalex cinctus]
MDDDYMLALKLQEQFDNEPLSDEEMDSGPLVPWKPEKPLSVVDAAWETLDPTPDVRAMFLEFNNRFFWGKLSGVEVKWSPRMTLCAGVCSYEGRGGLCSIRLSEPLLKLRPRKDLVETLLHEMIHALLFVTQNNRDRDSHGPEFCKHMKRINHDSGANITVFHNFTDEVDAYRQHWWRCDGPCQNRKPYFGYVKRAMNRAPSAQDPWWGDHQRTCGGTYVKVKEPEGYGKKKKEGKKDAVEKPKGSRDIRDVFAFSGKGFVLGGNSSSSSSASATMSAGPASSSLGKPADAPSPPARVVRPPAKKSVANTGAFVNINGSPLRIQTPHRGGVSGFGDGGREVGRRSVGGGSGEREDPPDKLNRTYVDDLFDNKPTNQSLIADSPGKAKSPIPSTSYHGDDDNAAPSFLPQWKKRPLDDSAGVSDLFNKRLKVESKEDGESASSSSPSSVVVMVTCPVCQAGVQESEINEHLDSCLCWNQEGALFEERLF